MKTRWLRHFLLGLVGVLVIAFGLLIFTATTAATRFYYSITDLGTLGGSESYALRISEVAQIVGTSQTSKGNYRKFNLSLRYNSCSNSIDKFIIMGRSSLRSNPYDMLSPDEALEDIRV